MSDLELLKNYLQNEIDVGSHKLFVFDKDDNVIEFKVIDALNEINNLQSQLQQKDNIINEFDKWLDLALEIFDNVDVPTLMFVKRRFKEIKGE